MSYKNIFTKIYENYGFGSSESRSGPGSTLYETKSLREKITQLVKEKNISTVVDIPCGDFNWMKEIVFSFEKYIGGDIVDQAIKENNDKYSSSRINFIVFDLLNDKIPDSDLLIVRDIIGHLPLEDGKKIVDNILQSNCKYLLSTTWAKKVNESWFKCETYEVDRNNEGVEYGSFYPVNLMTFPFNFPEPEIYLEEDVIVDRFEHGNRKVLGFWDISKLKDFFNNSKNEFTELPSKKNSHELTKITLVTGLWDLGRNNLTNGWSRSFDHYLQKLEQILQVEENLIIFGDKELEKFVYQKTTKPNIQFILRDLEWFKNNDYYQLIQNIRNDPKWFNQVGWLTESTQAKLEMYNPIVMSKMFLLNDAKLLDKFDSEYLFWIDAGLTNTIHIGYFTHDKVLSKLPKYISKFSFVCFPYDAHTEIHGFDYQKLNELAGAEVSKVSRGGFFGGTKESISNVNSIYYGLLLSTLKEGYMGTEESIFSIMTYKHGDLINYFEIESNGLMGKFFENLKNDNLKIESEFNVNLRSNLDMSKVGLYVITFNSPSQFKTLIESFIKYDVNYLNKTTKYLLDNSSDESTYEEYSKLCKVYNFEHIKKDNLGICGGRQWIAEHFDNTDLDYYLFFEDDMFFYPNEGTVCRNGFNRYESNLFSKTLEIMDKEQFDFLKLNFSEFFGDNGTQWSWYNVPQSVREEFWPDYPKLPQQGLDPNAPKAVYKNILSHNGVPYTKGEVYYSNWPQVVSRPGNKKMFLNTTWAHPFEQTWMSHMYQLTKKGELNPGLLLMTPTEHNRFDHYDGKLRKES